MLPQGEEDQDDEPAGEDPTPTSAQVPWDKCKDKIPSTVQAAMVTPAGKML